MNEIERIKKLFDDLNNGEPWIDINLSTLESITTQEAFTRISNLNTIAEIADHLVNWRRNVIKRIQGNVIQTPAHNYFQQITGIPEQAWLDIKDGLKKTHSEWTEALDRFNPTDFTKLYPGNSMSYYDHIQGILQHDAYHLGQIVLILKLVRKK